MNMPNPTSIDAMSSDAFAALAALEPSGLVGVQKAAALFLAIGEENAGKLIAKLDVDEVKVISAAMARLARVKAGQIETIFVEFTEKVVGADGFKGSLDATERLLMKVMSADQVALIMEDIRGPAGRTMWEKLSNVNAEVLAGYLKGEYPQTVAVVLTKIKPDQSAKVLSILPEMEAVDIMQRMLAMEVVQKEVLDDVEETLRTEFLTSLARTNRSDPHEMLAAVFNALDRNAETRLLGHLEDRNRESAEKIKALMFTFDDLKGLDNGGMQTLLRSVDKADLALALKGAPEAIRSLVLKNMAERASKILKEDMENSGPVRLKDVDAAQDRIVVIAKQLADAGDIQIAMGEEDDEMVF